MGLLWILFPGRGIFKHSDLGRAGRHAIGPDVSVTDAMWEVLDASVQVRRTRSPGEYAVIAARSCAAVCTRVVPTRVIVLPESQVIAGGPFRFLRIPTTLR